MTAWSSRDIRRQRGARAAAWLALVSVTLAASPVLMTPGKARAQSLVTGFDARACVEAVAPEMAVVRLAPVWNAGLEALAVNEAEREALYVTAGIFGTAEEAAAVAEAFIADSSIRFREGSIAGAVLGTATWSTDAAIVFHRDNVLVRVLSSDPKRTEEVAALVDRALTDGAAYVTRGADLARPSLSGVRTPAGDLAPGAEAEIRLDVEAGASAGERLHFVYRSQGGELLGGDPPAPLQYHPRATGEHTLRFQVVTEDCVVSPVFEMTVNVVEEGR